MRARFRLSDRDRGLLQGFCPREDSGQANDSNLAQRCKSRCWAWRATLRFGLGYPGRGVRGRARICAPTWSRGWHGGQLDQAGAPFLTAVMSLSYQDRASPQQRLEWLCDPRSLEPLDADCADGCSAGRVGARARAFDRLLRTGLLAGRRGRGRRRGRGDRRRPAAQPPSGGPAGRLPRVGGSAPSGRRRRARRLRAHLLRERRALGPRAPDLGDHRALGGRRLLLPRAHRLRRDDRARLDVPDGPADRQARARRAGHGGRLSGVRGCMRATASATSWRADDAQRDPHRPRAARPSAAERLRASADRRRRSPRSGAIRRPCCRRAAAATTTCAR